MKPMISGFKNLKLAKNMLKVQAFVPKKVHGFCQTSLPAWQLKILVRINVIFGTGTKFNMNENR